MKRRAHQVTEAYEDEPLVVPGMLLLRRELKSSATRRSRLHLESDERIAFGMSCKNIDSGGVRDGQGGEPFATRELGRNGVLTCDSNHGSLPHDRSL